MNNIVYYEIHGYPMLIVSIDRGGSNANGEIDGEINGEIDDIYIFAHS